MRSIFIVVACSLVLGACAIQRSVVANDAQSKMIGLSKEQVLACMGAPATKAAEGATEVWSYPSGNNHTVASTFGNVGRSGGFSATGVSESRFCTVNVTMVAGKVSRLN